MMWFWISAAMMAITAIIHSVAGEKRLIGPILAKDAIPTKQGQRVMRAAWHLTSLFMLTNALVMVWVGAPSDLLLVIGLFWLTIGLFSLMTSRGRHVGWPTLTAAGIAAIIGTIS